MAIKHKFQIEDKKKDVGKGVDVKRSRASEYNFSDKNGL